MTRRSSRQVPGHIFVGLLGVALLFAGLMNTLSGFFYSSNAGPIPREPGRPDIHYQATPQPAVEQMLDMAKVTQEDVVYDLGCGDGRFVITAAEKYGARGVGIDIDPKMIAISRRNAAEAGVEHLVEFRQADLFETDFREATVVALFLLPDLNGMLVPELKKLQPGSRILSYVFEIPGFPADIRDEAPSSIEGIEGTVPLHLWTSPLDKFNTTSRVLRWH